MSSVSRQEFFAGSTARDAAGAGGASAQNSFLFQLMVFWVFAMVFVALDLADGVRFMGDIDDRLRELQIRDLIADGEWFDRTLPFIEMPDAYISPWSRLVDAPYFLAAGALAPLFGPEAALHYATLVIPPVLLLAFCAATVAVLRSVCGKNPDLVRLALVAVAMTLAFWEFSPGRIDHHNLQLFAIMMMIAGLCWRRRGEFSRAVEYAGGALAGVAAVVSVSIGLECLPIILAALAVVGLNAVWGGYAARLRATGCGLAMAVGAPMAGFLLLGTEGAMQTACDAYSAPWIAGLTGGGAILALAGTPVFAVWSRNSRLAFLIIFAVCLAGVLAGLYPECLSGPYQMVDEAARSFWLDRVAQEKSALAFFSEGQYGLVAIAGFCCFLLIASIPVVRDRLLARDDRLAIIWIVGAVALSLTLFQGRFVRFVPAFAPLLLPVLISGMSQANGRRHLPILALAASVPVLASLAAFAAAPKDARAFDAVDLMSLDECKGADFSVLDQIEPGRIMAPPGLSIATAEYSNRHRIAGLGFHRAAPGITRMAHAFTSSDPALRRESLAPFNYVAVCVRNPAFDLGDAPLFQALLKGEGWPGLVSLTPYARNELGLYRIDHKSLK